jgi:predicted permease
MRVLGRLRRRLRALFRRDELERELDRELALHLDELTREHVAAGHDDEEARRLAARDFGSPDLAREQCRDARRVGVIEDLQRDVAYSFRLMRRSPGFTATVVLSLALGVGANTAIVALVDAVLLRALPVSRPGELVFLQVAGTKGSGGAPPYPAVERIRRGAEAFGGIAAFSADDLRVRVDGSVEQVFGQVASGNYFDVLGLRPAAGRLLVPGDEALEPAVAVIGYGYWQRRFGGRPDVIGRTVSFRDRTFTIVGVTPRDFWGLQPGRQVDLTIPITVEPGHLADAGAWWLEAVARLRPGVSAAQGAAQANAIFQAFMRESHGGDGFRREYFDRLDLAPAGRGLDRLRARFSQPLHALAIVGGAVLLLACANVGSLLVARAAARSHEMAVRVATGAGTSRLLRQLLTETVVLFVLGGLGGLAVAHVSIRAVMAFFAVGRNRIVLDVADGSGLVLSATLVAFAAALLTGLAPALAALRTPAIAVLRDGDARLAGSRRGASAGRWLVAAQAALSMILLVAAVLFASTMARLRAVDLGFDGQGVLTLSLDPVVVGTDAPATRARFWARVLAGVRELPGVQTASVSVLTPLSGRDTGKLVTVDGFAPASDLDRIVHVNHVSEDFFETFGVGLVAGRRFAASDRAGAVPVAIINEAAAHAYFPGRSPLGAMLRFDDTARRIVGVVRDAKHLSVRDPAPRFAYVPIWQPMDAVARVTLAVRSSVAPAALAHAVTHVVVGIHADTLVSDVVAVDDQVDAALVSERLLSTLASAFAALALSLAGVGLYGMLSYVVARRRAEFGVRMALGAPPRRVAAELVGEVLRLVAAGTLAGVPAAVAATWSIHGLLFGVTATDPLSYVVSALVLVGVAVAAALGPARRILRIDPAEALRRT